ncbi:3'(2'),5'-bisphosphate nucleotidase CysQ [Cyanosarcina cf. burmensis CCALA 770]|nr:3'(2'),5'-bisphosphate nucleotidase CysQ [Cyanosarcina cf. burmensis CCALA 770]
MPALEEILAIARSVGWGASYLLRSYYYGENKDNLDIKDKQGSPVTSADLAVNRYILDRLQTNLGQEEFAYITEETYKSSTPQPTKSWVWIIDPLDGTRDFIDKTGEYTIHIALVKDGRPVLSVVAYPEVEKLYFATLGGGTFVETRDGNIQQVKVSQRQNVEEFTIVVSRSHRGKKLEKVLSKLLCKKQKSVGSIGGKIAAIVEQQADVYISLSGKSAPKDWDLAAPELILTEAGGKLTHFDGTPLIYNKEDVSQWGGLIASNGECHDRLCAEAERILVEIENEAI